MQHLRKSYFEHILSSSPFIQAHSLVNRDRNNKQTGSKYRTKPYLLPNDIPTPIIAIYSADAHKLKSSLKRQANKPHEMPLTQETKLRYLKRDLNTLISDQFLIKTCLQLPLKK